jgi:predicted nucleic acid-binding protein
VSRRQPVVLDVNILVEAVVRGNNAFWSWPSPPPRGALVAAECVGIVNDCREFSLWLSPHVITNAARVLTDRDGYRWPEERAEQYITILTEISRDSGGEIIEPDAQVSDRIDYEDNRILELALAASAALVVSEDLHLLEMSPWRGIPLVSATEFVGRVDAMRRARRRR